MIYLDNAATTQPLAHLPALASEYSLDQWFNPSALYGLAVHVREILETCRRQLQAAFGFGAHRLVFNSGGTEGANTVLKAGIPRRKDTNVVIGGFEHPCVEESAKRLPAQGFELRHVPCDSHGRIHMEDVVAVMDEKTALVGVMHVNNETGACNDIAAMAAAVKRKNPRTLFFSDGVQAFLRTDPVDVSQIDYYTVSAHKIHALKGCGALFHLPRTPLKPFLDGGGQEGGLRSGTENVFGILAFCEAVRFFGEHAERLCRQREEQYALLWDTLSGIEDAVFLTPAMAEHRCSHIVCVSFLGIRGETLMHCLEEEDVFVSTGSACSSKKGKSRMESALGIDAAVAEGAIRISLGAFNTLEDVERATEAIGRQVKRLRTSLRK